MCLDKLEFKNDLLKSLDPRCRLAAGFLFIFTLLYVTKFLLLLVVIASAIILLARDIKTVLLRLGAVNMFCILLFVTMPLGGESIEAAFLYTLRVNAAALLYMFFIIPLGIENLAPALAALKVPAKLVSLLVLSYRYLFVLYRRVFYAVLSLRLRRPRQTTAMTWKSYGAVFASIFVSAFFRAQKVSRAARTRDFSGIFPVMRFFRWRMRDTFASIVLAVIVLTLLYIDRVYAWRF